MRKRYLAELLYKFLKLFYGDNCGCQRDVAEDFTHTVWRCFNVQFSEDFQKTRNEKKKCFTL